MIDKFYSMMIKIGITKRQDKVLHFIAGFIVGGVTIPFGAYAIVAVVLVALAKEAYNEYSYIGAGFDFFDFFVTCLGGVIGIMIVGVLL